MKKEKNTNNESWREVTMKSLLERAEPVYDCVKSYVQRTTNREWAITEHILRNFIDHPIKGNITMEAIEKAGVFILSGYHPFHVDSIEPHRFTVSYTDPVFIVVQGNEIIEANGTRKPATKEMLRAIENRGQRILLSEKRKVRSASRQGDASMSEASLKKSKK